jgi:uncharacterized protein YcfJ
VKRTTMATAAFAAVAVLAGCATTPLGPTVAAMPGANRPYPAFQQDDAYCRSEAANAVQGQVAAANNQQVGTALFTTLLGTALGAAVGGGHGAAIGAAAGAGVGTAYGVNQNQWQQMSIQQRYNVIYARCMYGHGDRIAGYGPPPSMGYPPPPPSGAYPPPPPGPPPPPPGE